MQAIVIALFVGVVGSLGSALFTMSSGPDRARQTAQALTARITISVALFALLLVGYSLGWIEPHGIR